MSNRLLTRAEVDHWMKTGQVPANDEAHCSLFAKQQLHCWHEPHGLWPGVLPPPLVCCWCNQESTDPGAVPSRHGPYCPEEP